MFLLDPAVRCTAVDVQLQWRSGQLFVKASWNKSNDVQKYLVKYREYSTSNSKNISMVSHSVTVKLMPDISTIASVITTIEYTSCNIYG